MKWVSFLNLLVHIMQLHHIIATSHLDSPFLPTPACSNGDKNNLFGLRNAGAGGDGL